LSWRLTLFSRADALAVGEVGIFFAVNVLESYQSYYLHFAPAVANLRLAVLYAQAVGKDKLRLTGSVLHLGLMR
jgi:hypothetical protein